MSDRNKNGHRSNYDDQNTRTTYIPHEVREQYRPEGQPQYREQPRQGGYYEGQPQYREQPRQGGYYESQPQYREQPRQDGYYEGQPQYREQPRQGGYYEGQSQYREQPRQGGYYEGQPQYREQPRQGGYYEGQPQYREQPRQGGYYEGQPQYREQPRQGGYYEGQPQYREQPRQPRREGQPQYREQPRQPRREGQQPQYREQPRQPHPDGQQPHRQRRPAPPPQRKPRKQKSGSGVGKFFRRLIITLLVLALLLFGIYSFISLSLIKKMNYQETGERNRTSGALARSYVTSVLVIGTDGRTLDDRGRSDSMILVSLNSATNEMSLTSFMRDCYVEVPGYGWDKLNAAYAYGGAELLMDTIEHNFGVKIDDYVSINFISFAQIVDAVGGIDVDLTDEEAQELNVIMEAEVNDIMGDDPRADLLSSGGKDIHLSGKQALSYARIRHVGNADFERTERQRRVIGLVTDKLKTNPFKLANFKSDVMPYVTTNMETSELYLLSLRAPLLLGYDREQLQIPIENSYHGESTASGDALVLDFDVNYETIKNTVFDK